MAHAQGHAGHVPPAEPAPSPQPHAEHETAEQAEPATGSPKDAAAEGSQMPPAPLALSRNREGSGTSWLPDESPMRSVHGRRGGWELMLHGYLVAQYLAEEGERGDADLGSVNWLMGMARRPLARGELELRSMLSLEPATLGPCGYPLLLASGETCDGRPLHDRQHPHDFFMELAAGYRREMAPSLATEVYAAIAGEPALGPTAFPHRPSAMADPSAPIGHHWLDATHISFGVLTAGLFGPSWKAEASLFNGREPDEQRWDLDLAPLDSYSARLWWLPGSRWSLQLSGGHLEEAELEPERGARLDVDRITASATYHRLLEGERLVATTLAWGRNREQGEATDALLLEASADLTGDDTLFGRLEWVEKTAHDLDLAGARLHDGAFRVGRASLGYSRRIARWAGWEAGVGGRISWSQLPAELDGDYGGRHPFGWGIFASLRPASMSTAVAHPHAGGR
jgi:hypothetical protein